MCSQGTVVISVVARIPVVAGTMVVAGMVAMTMIHTLMVPPHWGSFASACRGSV